MRLVTRLVPILLIPALTLSCVSTAAYNALKSESDETSRLLTESERENEDLRLALDTALSQNESLSDQAAGLRLELAALNAEMDESLQLRNVAVMTSAQLEQTVEQLREDREELEATLASLQTEQDDANTNLDELIAALNRAQDESGQIRRNLQTIQLRHDDLVGQVSQLLDERESMMASLQAARQTEAQTLDDLGELRGELIALRNELASAVESRDTAQSRAAVAESTNESLMTDIRDLNTGIRGLLAEFRSLRVAYAQYIRMMQAQVTDLRIHAAGRSSSM